jgi:hypothetical protein
VGRAPGVHGDGRGHTLRRLLVIVNIVGNGLSSYATMLFQLSQVLDREPGQISSHPAVRTNHKPNSTSPDTINKSRGALGIAWIGHAVGGRRRASMPSRYQERARKMALRQPLHSGNRLMVRGTFWKVGWSTVAHHALSVLLSAATIMIVLVLTLWVYPGDLAGGPSCSHYTIIGERSYCSETLELVQQECISVYGPPCPSPGWVAFRGVNFSMSLENSSGAPAVEARVVESNSRPFGFTMIAEPFSPPTINWTSPDHLSLVQWSSPYYTVTTNGLFITNVTCGVYAAMVGGV